MEQINFIEGQQPIGKVHACRVSQRGFQEARDRLRRANRDLGETAAFIAASLTTVTAVEAVINLATGTEISSKSILRIAFDIYLVLIMLILVWGFFRARNAVRRRMQAEKEIDQAKKGIFEFCPGEQWPKPEES